MQIAFIGLGIMGLPMAENLIKAGHMVVGFNRSESKIQHLVAAGGTGGADIASAVRGAEVVVTMLPDSRDVADVYRKEGGVFAAAKPGALLIDASTIRPDVAAELHREATEEGFEMLDAPVSGGQQGAVEGVLSIMCGGTESAFERALPVLQAVGNTVIRVGAGGSGQTVKAANQLLVAGTIQLVSEALVFLDAHGVQLAPAIEVLNGGLAGNTILTRKADAMIAGRFEPGFRVSLHSKDLGIYQDAARGLGLFSPVGALMGQLMDALRVTGGAQLDHSALLEQTARLSGRGHWGQA